jgi:hypothetical protein
VVEQGTHKPLVGSSTLPPGTNQDVSFPSDEELPRIVAADCAIVLVVVLVLVLDGDGVGKGSSGDQQVDWVDGVDLVEPIGYLADKDTLDRDLRSNRGRARRRGRLRLRNLIGESQGCLAP